MWNTFKCKTFEDYHDLYLKTDVLLLADFFENFRETCLENYGLDACHYYSAPGLAWDAALKMSKIKLQLFDNEEMYTFMERSIRGGVSMITKRHAKANNPECRNHNPNKDNSHLIYLDANNLYGWAMSQYLPTHGFEWMKENDIEKLDINSIPQDGEDGFIFEVDLDYPMELHDLHNDYPLAPERLTIDESMLSPFQWERFPDYQIKNPQVKLTPNLNGKTNYVVHYRNLQFYLNQGMKLKKVHRVLTFKQRPWLKEYIDYNTKCRAQSKSKFAKDFYKLMNNSVFGKTQENLRNRVNVEIITDKKIALKRAAKPNFERSQTLREDLVVIQNKVITLKLNKPLYVGFTVLDLSKLLMYDFHYNKMLKWYNDINLCFTDTDSLLYEIKTDNIYNDMQEHADEYDFSEYAFDHPNYDPKNKKVIGKMKDELCGMCMDEFTGLRPKCYSILSIGKVKDNVKVNNDEVQFQKAKGSKKDHLNHDDYNMVLEKLESIVVKQNVIRSKKHTVKTYHTKKVALTAFDTKRYILDDNINTLAYGHYKTQSASRR